VITAFRDNKTFYLSRFRIRQVFWTIGTKADYHAALKEIEALMTLERDTPAGKRLDFPVTLVEAYENKHYGRAQPVSSEAVPQI
jgi:antitoxin component HigA of HigAB toxin-antitoxin module